MVTEAKISRTITSTIADNDIPFVELYNRQRSVPLSSLVMSGLVETRDNFGGSTIWEQGQYLVLYNNTLGGNITCQDCDCQPDGSNIDICNNTIYVKCNNLLCDTYFDKYDYSSWSLELVVSTDGNSFDFVSYVGAGQTSSANELKFNGSLGYSFELISTGFNNTNLFNWQISCYNTGTPGAPPILASACSQVCFLPKCQVYGAQNVSVESQTNRCDCSNDSHYYHDGCSCKPGIRMFDLHCFCTNLNILAR